MLDGGAGFDGGAGRGMNAVAQQRVVVHDGSHIDNAPGSHHRVGAHKGEGQHQTARTNGRRGADLCRRVYKGRGLVAGRRQFLQPGQTQTVIPQPHKSRRAAVPQTGVQIIRQRPGGIRGVVIQIDHMGKAAAVQQHFAQFGAKTTFAQHQGRAKKRHTTRPPAPNALFS